ncbi:MAG: CerR family C-terminal domain-containing protein [Gammaproteobacteria bacterium]
MALPQTKPIKTRMRLLIAASRIFAEKGFMEATIAEICEQAETNIASVNYHFRDKETLYLEAWRYAFNNELATHPSDGGVRPDAPADQKLAGRIRSLIARIADDRSYSFAIINKEMAQPTRLLPEILEKEIEPQRRQMLALIRECLGPGASDKQMLFCHASIIGQCFHLLKMKHLQSSGQIPFKLPALADASAFADHVVQFSLAGIQAVRRQIEQDNPC